MIEKETENAILTAQKIEITAHFVYHKLSQSAMDPRNKSVLKQISDDELKHYNFWKIYTRQDAKPNKLSIWKYHLISRIFGITFGIFLLVINGLMLWLVAALVRGFYVNGFWGALFGSILISIVSWILSRVLPS